MRPGLMHLTTLALALPFTAGPAFAATVDPLGSLTPLTPDTNPNGLVALSGTEVIVANLDDDVSNGNQYTDQYETTLGITFEDFLDPDPGFFAQPDNGAFPNSGSGNRIALNRNPAPQNVGQPPQPVSIIFDTRTTQAGFFIQVVNDDDFLQIDAFRRIDDITTELVGTATFSDPELGATKGTIGLDETDENAKFVGIADPSGVGFDFLVIRPLRPGVTSANPVGQFAFLDDVQYLLPIPEPSSAVLLAAALGLIHLRRRRS